MVDMAWNQTKLNKKSLIYINFYPLRKYNSQDECN